MQALAAHGAYPPKGRGAKAGTDSHTALPPPSRSVLLLHRDPHLPQADTRGHSTQPHPSRCSVYNDRSALGPARAQWALQAGGHACCHHTPRVLLQQQLNPYLANPPRNSCTLGGQTNSLRLRHWYSGGQTCTRAGAHPEWHNTQVHRGSPLSGPSLCAKLTASIMYLLKKCRAGECLPESIKSTRGFERA